MITSSAILLQLLFTLSFVTAIIASSKVWQKYFGSLQKKVCDIFQFLQWTCIIWRQQCIMQNIYFDYNQNNNLKTVLLNWGLCIFGTPIVALVCPHLFLLVVSHLHSQLTHSFVRPGFEPTTNEVFFMYGIFYNM